MILGDSRSVVHAAGPGNFGTTSSLNRHHPQPRARFGLRSTPSTKSILFSWPIGPALTRTWPSSRGTPFVTKDLSSIKNRPSLPRERELPCRANHPHPSHPPKPLPRSPRPTTNRMDTSPWRQLTMKLRRVAALALPVLLTLAAARPSPAQQQPV